MRWIYALLMLYLVACAGIYFIQERVIFDPRRVPESYRYPEGDEVEVPLEEGLTMNCLWQKNGRESRGVILYLHGNRGTADRALFQIRRMAGGNNYDFFIPDYRGYGKTEGGPTSGKQLQRDANRAYQFLLQHYPEEAIVVVGYSLGTGMASFVAASNAPQHLVLLAPYSSLMAMKNEFLWFVPDFLLKYQLSNVRYLPEVNCPVTIAHGTHDQVIRYEYSGELVRIDPERINLVTLQGEDHRGIIFDPSVKEAFNRVLAPSKRHTIR